MERENSFERILLATDGSDQSEAAVDATIELARFTGTVVRVAHICAAGNRGDAETLLAGTVERLWVAGVMADKEVVGADPGHVAAAISTVAREFKADLVVLGSRGLSDWSSLFKHSVSHQVLAAVDCPVLVVRTRPAGDIASTRRILVAVAGGDDIAPAVRAAAAVARSRRCAVMAVHVAQAIVSPPGLAYFESDEEIRSTIAQALQELRDAGVAAEGMVAPAGPVATTLARVAEDWNADLIVTGSSRMGDAASLVFGSVSHGLLHESGVPVLIAERVKP
ncbi:MAG TPA: universal stress protein [Candidatus Dormibacteraeota bacterium]|nr:universal stress protein [Candidatus Dormibacteraeota bacterium]